MALTLLASGLRSRVAETARPEDAEVGLEHHHVLVELGAVLFAVRLAAAPAVLLVGPQHEADGPPRPQPQLLHDPQRFPRHDASAAVVARAGADVPRIEVSADDHDFVGPLAAAKLADDVRGQRFGLEVRFHLQAHDDVAALGEALQAIGVLGGDRRRGNVRRVWGVLQAARVREAEPVGSDGAHQHRHRAVAGRARRTAGSKDHRVVVVRERHVEQHDPPPRLGRVRRRGPRSSGRRAAAPRCRPRVWPRCRRDRASRSAGAPARRCPRSRCRAPTPAPSPARCGRSPVRRASFRRPPTESRDRAAATR